MKAQVPGPPTVTSSPILKVISPLSTQATSSLSRCRWNVVSVPEGAVSSNSMMLSAVSLPTSLSAAERPGAMLSIDPPPGGTTKPFPLIAFSSTPAKANHRRRRQMAFISRVSAITRYVGSELRDKPDLGVGAAEVATERCGFRRGLITGVHSIERVTAARSKALPPACLVGCQRSDRERLIRLIAGSVIPAKRGYLDILSTCGEVQSSRRRQAVEQRRRAGEQWSAARQHQGPGNLVRPTSRLADDQNAGQAIPCLDVPFVIGVSG